MNRGDEGLGGIVWELDDGSTLPKHEESIYRDQKVIQLRISEHVLVDRDEDWSDIHLKSPQKLEEPKILKNKDRKVVSRQYLILFGKFTYSAYYSIYNLF